MAMVVVVVVVTSTLKATFKNVTTYLPSIYSFRTLSCKEVRANGRRRRGGGVSGGLPDLQISVIFK